MKQTGHKSNITAKPLPHNIHGMKPKGGVRIDILSLQASEYWFNTVEEKAI